VAKAFAWRAEASNVVGCQSFQPDQPDHEWLARRLPLSLTGPATDNTDALSSSLSRTHLGCGDFECCTSPLSVPEDEDRFL